MPEWQPLRLGDAIEIKHGYAFKGEHFSDNGGGPLLVTPGNFMLGGGFKSGKPKYYLGPVPPEFELAPGDLVVTMTDLSKPGDTLGYPAIVPSGQSYLHNQRIGLIVNKTPSKIDERYLYYVLRTNSYRNHVLAGATGSTVRHTSPSRICDYQFLVPTLYEQQAIATVLGSLDDKIAINDKIAGACHVLAESHYRELTRDLPEVPLSSLMTPILGGTPDRGVDVYWGTGNPWASAKDVAAAKFGVLLSTEEQITELAATTTRAKPVSAGSVILTARGTVGAVARVVQSAALNQSCYAFVPGSISPAALYLIVRTAARQMLGVSHGTVFSTVNMKTFDHVTVPNIAGPSLALVESQAAPLLDVITCRVLENQSLAQLRDALLPRLMSGEIRVGDAERVVEGAT